MPRGGLGGTGGGEFGTGSSYRAPSRGGSANGGWRPRPLSPCQRCPSGDAETPEVRLSTSQRRVKGEDVVFMREGASRSPGAPSWSLYCICDGHRGAGAAKYVKRHLWSALAPLLPRTRPAGCESEDFRQFALKVSTAVVEALVEAVLPLRRTRLLMGSDGLWDMIQWQKAPRMIRDTPIAAAASRLVSGALSAWGGPAQDDTTAMVLDILPARGGPAGPAPPAAGKTAAKKERKFGGLLSSCLCLAPEIGEASNRSADPDQQLRTLARIDGIDLIRSSANGLGCRISMASARARQKAEEVSRRSDPAHWAPAAAFLTAQRAQLGARSAGPTPSRAAAKRAAANGLRGPRKGAPAGRTTTNLSGLFY
eukprot:evm.model.scf_65.4 EVM.evm.TU.scf_65.4   scf_65:25408-30186(-)